VAGLASLDRRFAGESFRAVDDAAVRRARIANLVAANLVTLAGAAAPPPEAAAFAPLDADVARFAGLVLGPDQDAAGAFIADLRERRVPAAALFGGLLEPAARLLGVMWDRDEIDFTDVALGVARLQALLALFNGTHRIADLDDRRCALMLTLPGERHSFGIAMVENCLEAGGWQVASEREIDGDSLAQRVGRDWFAVIGIAVSSSRNLRRVADAIESIRRCSRNPAVGVIVGGPVFSGAPELAASLGADGSALSGPLAVVLAQKLLDDALARELGEDTRSALRA
jgi:methanogenic corrinoid protein MtbC1